MMDGDVEKHALNVIDEIISCINSGLSINSPLQYISDVTSSRGAILFMRDRQNLEIVNHNIVGIPDQQMEIYINHFMPHDEIAKKLLRHETFRQAALSTSDIFGDRIDYNKSFFYNDFMKTYGNEYYLGYFFGGDVAPSNISLVRTPDHQEFNENEKRFLNIIGKHFDHFQRIQELKSRSNVESQSLLELLAGSGLAIFFIDSDGVPSRMNGLAEKIIRDADGLAQDSRGHLIASDHCGNEELARLIAVATAPNAGARDPGMILKVPRPSGRRSYRVEVMPMWRRADPSPGNCAAMIVVTSPEMVGAQTDGRIMKWLGLTAAEARLAALLAANFSVKDAAIELGVTEQTARSRLKVIFEKTGNKKQSELVRDIIAMPPAIGD